MEIVHRLVLYHCITGCFSPIRIVFHNFGRFPLAIEPRFSHLCHELCFRLFLRLKLKGLVNLLVILFRLCLFWCLISNKLVEKCKALVNPATVSCCGVVPTYSLPLYYIVVYFSDMLLNCSNVCAETSKYEKW